MAIAEYLSYFGITGKNSNCEHPIQTKKILTKEDYQHFL